MKKERVSPVLIILLVLALVFSAAGILVNFVVLRSLDLPITGLVTETGTIQFQINGTTGILITDSGIFFGAGFFNSNTTNSTCSTRGYSVLESNDSVNPDPRLSPNANVGVTSSCWINQSRFLNGTTDFHRLENNGTIGLNITAQGDKNARDFICGIGASCNTSLANIQLLSKDAESGSCAAGLTGTYRNLSSGASTNATIGICDNLGSNDPTDTIDITVNISAPHNIFTGNKTLTITYTAISV